MKHLNTDETHKVSGGYTGSDFSFWETGKGFATGGDTALIDEVGLTSLYRNSLQPFTINGTFAGRELSRALSQKLIELR